MDQTLLESRARKWEEMGKPWFNGLASGQGAKGFSTSWHTYAASKELLKREQPRKVDKTGTGLALALVFGFIARAWQQGLSVEHTLLKLKSRSRGFISSPKWWKLKPVPFDGEPPESVIR